MFIAIARLCEKQRITKARWLQWLNDYLSFISLCHGKMCPHQETIFHWLTCPEKLYSDKNILISHWDLFCLVDTLKLNILILI